MPIVGQAPAVIEIPELSDKEKSDRLGELESAIKLHSTIRAKIAKVIPLLDDIIQDCAKFEHTCSSSYLLRAVHLSRTFRSPLLLKVVALSRTELNKIAQAAEKVERRSGTLEAEALDPGLPGIQRDFREMNKMVRKRAEERKKDPSGNPEPVSTQKPEVPENE